MANNSEREKFRAVGRWAGTIAGAVRSEATMISEERVEEEELAKEPHEQTHFEPTDINSRGTFLVGVSVFVGMWVIVCLLYLYFSYLAHYRAEVSPPPLPIEQHRNPLPPEPRLQPHPPEDLKALRTREDWQLNHYSWIDQSKGVVAIPIDQAINILAQRGIPAQTAPPRLVLSQPQAGTRETGFEGKVQPEPQ